MSRLSFQRLQRRGSISPIVSTDSSTPSSTARSTFSWAVRRAMQRVRPDLLILAELELWPNLITAAKAHGASVAIINGRLSDNSFRGYRRVGWLVRRVLDQSRLDSPPRIKLPQSGSTACAFAAKEKFFHGEDASDGRCGYRFAEVRRRGDQSRERSDAAFT